MSEHPPLLTRSQAAELTGMNAKYLDSLRRKGVVRVYTMLCGTSHRFYRDDLLEHLGLLKEKENEKH